MHAAHVMLAVDKDLSVIRNIKADQFLIALEAQGLDITDPARERVTPKWSVIYGSQNRSICCFNPWDTCKVRNSNFSENWHHERSSWLAGALGFKA